MILFPRSRIGLRGLVAIILIASVIGCTSESRSGDEGGASDSALRDYIQTPKEKAGAVAEAAEDRASDIEDAVQELEE